MKTGVIIQARTGSTRLPKKMVLPFYEKKTILDILLQRINDAFDSIDVIVATTTNKNDDAIVEIAERNSVKIYRGSENDVLSRFVNAANDNNFDSVIRICADNPFLSMKKLKELIDFSQENPYEYISFKTSDGIPSIKTHFGFWTEFITLEALKKIQRNTDENLYHEHVTNYAYTHPDLFSCHFIPIDKNIERSEIRLTVDTEDDFKNASYIFAQLMDKELSVEPENIVPIISDKIRLSMQKQIKENSK